MMTLEKLKEVYWYVLQRRHGKWSDLDQIHEEAREYLDEGKVIACGYINSVAEPGWKLTALGRLIASCEYRRVTMELFREKNRHTVCT